MYAFLDRVHAGALLHRKMAEVAVEHMHLKLNGDHPTVPLQIDWNRGVLAGDIVAAWEAAGGAQLPGYGDGSEVDAVLQPMFGPALQSWDQVAEVAAAPGD